MWDFLNSIWIMFTHALFSYCGLFASVMHVICIREHSYFASDELLSVKGQRLLFLMLLLFTVRSIIRNSKQRTSESFKIAQSTIKKPHGHVRREYFYRNVVIAIGTRLTEKLTLSFLLIIQTGYWTDFNLENCYYCEKSDPIKTMKGLCTDTPSPQKVLWEKAMKTGVDSRLCFIILASSFSKAKMKSTLAFLQQ